MGKRILLIEPYPDLAGVFGFHLNELGYQYDVVEGTEIDESDLTDGRYECLLINIDQNSDRWRDCDHQTDAAKVLAEGWKPIRKPFTLEKLAAAISWALAPT